MEYNCDVLIADPSFDVWSLGCIFFQLFNSEVLPLWQCDQDDNLSAEPSRADSLFALAEWSDETKSIKLGQIKDPLARNLASQMPTKDASKRVTLERVLAHPFMSGKSVVRCAGMKAKYDVFISYRYED